MSKPPVPAVPGKATVSWVSAGAQQNHRIQTITNSARENAQNVPNVSWFTGIMNAESSFPTNLRKVNKTPDGRPNMK